MTEAWGQKLSREAELLGSLPHELPHGISEAIDDAWQNKGRTAFEAGSAIVLGTAFTLLSRNPNQYIKMGTKYLGYGFAGLASADLGSRFYLPMQDAWNNPQNLEKDKKWLGNNVGDAALNYGLAIVGGGGGAFFGERYLESTKLGEIISGQKVTHFSARSFPDDNALAKNIKSFAALNPELSAKAPQQFTLHEFRDGTSLLHSSDGIGLLKPSSGEEIWFKARQNWWSLQPTIESVAPELSGLPRPIGSTPFLEPRAVSQTGVDLKGFMNRLYPWEKGSEGGIGAIASEWALERAGDIGSGILQHKILVKDPNENEKKPAEEKKTDAKK